MQFHGSRAKHSLVHEILQQFQIGPDDVRNITQNFLEQMKDGLIHPRPWQLPSYVHRIPDGSEKGKFLVVDLGGTNCRICLVDLLGDSTYNVMQTKQTVPEHVRINSRYEPLFSFIAEAISDFLDQHGLRPNANPGHATQRIPLGFTFSFTCEQTSISQGTLMQWDKGWDIPEALGKDPCAMLQESISAIELPVQVSALANDSVGTLLSRAYTSQGHASTLAGVIIGTGTNAAYIERMSNVPRVQKSDMNRTHEIIVLNTEWGCFDDGLQVLPTTSYDRALDAGSTNPGNQQLEKRVSGMYLGELMRLVILDCQNQGVFDMVLTDTSPCNRQYGLDSSFLSSLVNDETVDPSNVAKAVERELLACDVTLSDLKIMQQLADGIVKRSGRLAGSALGAIVVQSNRLTRVKSQQHDIQPSENRRRDCRLLAIIRKLFRNLAYPRNKLQLLSDPTLAGETEKDVIDIGVDGSLIELYPGFESFIRSTLRDLKEIGQEGEQRIRIGLARDGSSVGAALIANASILEGT